MKGERPTTTKRLNETKKRKFRQGGKADSKVSGKPKGSCATTWEQKKGKVHWLDDVGGGKIWGKVRKSRIRTGGRRVGEREALKIIKNWEKNRFRTARGGRSSFWGGRKTQGDKIR